jgi:cysteinyl-tRNA synthetase
LVSFFVGVQPRQDLDINQVQENHVIEQMSDCLADDFNTSGLFGVLFESLNVLQHDEHAKAQVKYFLIHVMGLTLEPLAEKVVEITPEIQMLLDARLQARVDKQWMLADELRDQLKALGFEVQDKKL